MDPVGQCAQHPDRAAYSTCETCGSFACPYCTVSSPWGPDCCVACVDAGRRGPPIPWESSGGLWATGKVVGRQTRVFFGSFRSGPMSPALTYALAQNALLSTFVQLAVLIGRVTRGVHPAFSQPVGTVILWLGLPLYSVAWCLLVGTVLSLLLSLAGARVSRSDCLRAALYTSPAPYVAGTCMVVGPGRTFWALFALGFAMSMARPLSYFARGRGELPDATGNAAAFAAALTGVLVLGGPLAWVLGVFR